MSDNELFYKHSGRFEPVGLAWSLTAMVLAGVAMGFLYGALAWIVPSVYLVIFGCAGVGLGLGYLCAQLSVLAKTRNNELIILGPTLASLLALYAAWSGYIYAASDWTYLMLSPIELFETASNFAKSGLWSISSLTPKGMFLVAFWLAEAGLILGLAGYIGTDKPRNLPYNEQADAWADQTEVLGHAKALSPETIKQIRQQLKAGDLSCFGLFEPLDDPNATMHTAFRINWAEGFEHEQFLTITSITITEDEKGNIQTKKNPIAVNMIIDPQARAVIDDILSPQQPATEELAGVDEETADEGFEDTDEPEAS